MVAVWVSTVMVERSSYESHPLVHEQSGGNYMPVLSGKRGCGGEKRSKKQTDKLE